MGYESRIIVMNRSELTRPNGGNWVYTENWVYAEKIAEMNMCCMGSDFKKLFEKPIDYTIYVNDEKTDEDCYGEHIKYATIDRIVEWLENYNEDYRRIAPLLGLLKGFDESEWDELQVLHYGY